MVPDIKSIIDSLEKEASAEAPPETKEAETPPVKTKPVSEIRLQPSEKGSLWNEFVKCLEEETTENENISIRRYSIDDDLLWAIQQCRIRKSTTRIINAILRSFLIANMDNLREVVKQRPRSLLDTCNTE